VEPLQTDRPDFTDSPTVVPRHSIQIEGGYTFTRSSDERTHAIGEVLVRVGAFEKLEIRVAVNSFTIRDSREGRQLGLEDMDLGVKLQLLRHSNDRSWKPDLALIAATSIPTGTGDSPLQPYAKLCTAWEIPLGFSLGTNFNYTSRKEMGWRLSEFAASASLGRTITGKIGGYFEFFGFNPSGHQLQNSRFLNGGITFLVTDGFQLDIRVGVGLNQLKPDYFTGIGFAKRW
jgi:hypothetical protein